jgi:hypothetical protein
VVFDVPDGAAEPGLDGLGVATAPASNHLLVVSLLTQSELYHEIKCRLPDDRALFVGVLAATPTMEGQAAGSVAWTRDAVASNDLFTDA